MNGIDHQTAQYASQYIAHAGIALFGAVVHALEAQRKGSSKTFADFAALVVMSSFSGVMFALVAVSYLQDQVYLTTAIAGTGGYIGVEGMSFIVEYLKKKFK